MPVTVVGHLQGYDGSATVFVRIFKARNLVRVVSIILSTVPPSYVLLPIFCVGPISAQNIDKGTPPPTITVRLINGKNGKPVSDDAPNIHFAGDNARYGGNPPTNSNGEVVVSVHSPDIEVMPNLYADCRYKHDSTAGLGVKYSIEEILRTGIVSENFCGKHRLKPLPGVLILYVRPRTLFEGMRL
jgi:hypothetical protein